MFVRVQCACGSAVQSPVFHDTHFRKVLWADGRLVNMSGVFCTNNAQAPSLFSNVTLTSRRSYVETVSGNNTEEGHCRPKLFQHTIVCLLVLRWKRGRELVHCLYKKTPDSFSYFSKQPAFEKVPYFEIPKIWFDFVLKPTKVQNSVRANQFKSKVRKWVLDKNVWHCRKELVGRNFQRNPQFSGSSH